MLCSLETFSCFLPELLGENGRLRLTEERGSPVEQESKSVGRLLRWSLLEAPGGPGHVAVSSVSASVTPGLVF